MLIDIHTFRLADGIEDAAFLAADAAVQTEFTSPQYGFVRRTTARGDDGTWLVLEFWYDQTTFDAAVAAGRDDPAVKAFLELIDPASVSRGRYTTIE